MNAVPCSALEESAQSSANRAPVPAQRSTPASGPTITSRFVIAMSHLALTKIHSHLGNNELASEHHEKLQRLGGEESMDSAWIDALETSLSRLKGAKSEE